MPVPGIRVLEWDIRDPIGRDEKVYREVRDEIERRVMELILHLRADERREEASGAGRTDLYRPATEKRRW